MASLITPTRLLGNLAALAILPIGGAVIVDYVGGLAGYHPGALCLVAQPVVNLAGMVATILISLGVVIYAISRFRSEAAMALMIGGVLIFVAPMVLPHYLDASCVLPSTAAAAASVP
jgi:hypothetical protein